MNFLDRYVDLASQGAAFVAVTVVDVEGSTPTQPAAKMLVSREGLEFGTVGGGRLEARAVEQAQRMLHNDSQPTCFVQWNLRQDIGMTCGGSVKLFFEACNHNLWHIVIFGAGHVTQAVVRLLADLPCQMTCIDPRPQWLSKLPAVATLTTVQSDHPATEVSRLPADAFVLCMTRGHASDLPVLEQIYQGDRKFPFVGVIGSKSKAAVLRRELREAGIAESDLGFYCPVGLELGTNHPAEIAVSIVAQLLQFRDANTT